MRRTLFISNIGWDFVWQRHQTLASLFARDSEVIFCEIPGMRRVDWRDIPRLFARLKVLAGGAHRRGERPPTAVRIIRPLVLPATNRLFCAVNQCVLGRLARTDAFRTGFDLIINYSPSRSARQLLAQVPHRRLVYDCTDNWLAMRGIPAFLAEDEQTILGAADLTLVPSRALEAQKGRWARKVVRLPHGAFVERFSVSPRVRGAAPFTVLYYGHLHRQHLDFGAIDLIARSRPLWRIILVGPVKTPHPFPPNVELPGQQPHELLQTWIAQADVLLLPYRLNEYTRAVMPAKTYECLASGRPIVAAPLPELVADFAAYMQFARNPDEWVGVIESAAAHDGPGEQERRIALAQQNTWQRRYEELSTLLGALDHPPAA